MVKLRASWDYPDRPVTSRRWPNVGGGWTLHLGPITVWWTTQEVA